MPTTLLLSTGNEEFATAKEALARLHQLYNADPNVVLQNGGLTLLGISGDDHEKVAYFAGGLVEGRRAPALRIETDALLDRPIDLLEYRFEKNIIKEEQLGDDFLELLKQKATAGELTISATRLKRMQTRIDLLRAERNG